MGDSKAENKEAEEKGGGVKIQEEDPEPVDVEAADNKKLDDKAEAEEDEKSLPTPGCTWAYIKWSLYRVFYDHTLFGVFLVKPGDPFTRCERIWGLMGFLGIQMSCTAGFDSWAMVQNTVCACIRGKDPTTSCTIPGNVTWSLLPNPNLNLNQTMSTTTQGWNYGVRNEWEPHIKNFYWNNITDAMAVCPTLPADPTPCATKLCCDANVGYTLGPLNYQNWPVFDYANPCQTQITDMIVSALLGSLITLIALDPLVQWALRRESQNCNPLAYLLIWSQVAGGIFTMILYTNSSKQIGLGTHAWTSALISILFGLFVTNVLIDIVLQSCVTPLLTLWCSCCSCCSAAASPPPTTTRSRRSSRSRSFGPSEDLPFPSKKEQGEQQLHDGFAAGCPRCE